MRNHNYHIPVVDQDRFLNIKLHPHIKSIVGRCPSAENPESSRSDAALTCWKAASRQPLHPPALPVLRTALAFNRPLAPPFTTAGGYTPSLRSFYLPKTFRLQL